MHAYIILLYISTGILLTLAAYTWFRRDERGATVLLLFLLSVLIASFCHAMNLAALDLAQKKFWNHAEYLGAAYVPTLMLTMALVFTGQKKWLRPWPLAALFLVPFTVMLANWSNDWHGLYYSRIWMEPSGDYLLFAKDRGPLYFLFVGQLYGSCLLAFFFLITALRRPGLRARPELILLLGGYLIPFALNIPYTLRLMPHKHINLSLLGLFFTAFLLTIAIFRYRLITILPLDKDERIHLLLNHTHALLYTISSEGTMTYVSPNWPRVLGHAPEEVVGRHFSVFVLPEDHATCHAFLERVVATGTMQSGAQYRVVHKQGHLVWHTSSIVPVHDAKGRLLAFAGAAHDITELKSAQQELSEANQRLSDLIVSREAELCQAIAATLTAAENEARRIGEDIHDGLCQELIALARLAETAAAEIPGSARHEHIQAHATRLALVARAFSHDLTLHDLYIQTLPEALETLARRTDQLFQTETELSLPPQLVQLTHEQNQYIYRIIREAVANAVKHAQPRHIWIDLVRESNQLALSVSNDGQPLPESTRMFEGLGMKQMRMRAGLLGGDLKIRRNRQNLTVLELIIPLQGEAA